MGQDIVLDAEDRKELERLQGAEQVALSGALEPAKEKLNEFLYRMTGDPKGRRFGYADFEKATGIDAKTTQSRVTHYADKHEKSLLVGGKNSRAAKTFAERQREKSEAKAKSKRDSTERGDFKAQVESDLSTKLEEIRDALGHLLPVVLGIYPDRFADYKNRSDGSMRSARATEVATAIGRIFGHILDESMLTRSEETDVVSILKGKTPEELKEILARLGEGGTIDGTPDEKPARQPKRAAVNA